MNLGFEENLLSPEFLLFDPTFQYVSWSIGISMNDSIIASGRNMIFSQGCVIFFTSAPSMIEFSDWFSTLDRSIRDSFWIITGCSLSF